MQDPTAVKAKVGASGGALTWTFTDRGENLRRINPTGHDACSYFFPDMQHLVFTSSRDNLDLTRGNWSDPRDYPIGSELYLADIDGKNVKRLSRTKVYDAEISVSPDGTKLAFARSLGKRFMSDNFVHIMDISSLGIGPVRRTGPP